jgi:fumarate reductase subunit D
MKKKLNLIILFIVCMFVVQSNVLADSSITCKASDVTCEFTNKGGSSNYTCKDGSGKKYTALNHNGHLDNKGGLSDVINNYSYQDNSSCPAAMLVSKSDKEVILLKDTSTFYLGCDYAVEYLNKNNLTCDASDSSKPLVKASMSEAVDYINLVYQAYGWGSGDFASYTSSQGEVKVGEDCDSQLQALYDKVVDKQTDAKTANCSYDIKKDNCEKLMSDWKSAISNGKNSAQALQQKGVCTQAQIDSFNKRIGEQTEDYNLMFQSRQKISEEEGSGDSTGKTDPTVENVSDALQICDENENPKIVASFRLVGIFVTIIKIIAPIIIIIMGMFEMSKAVIEGKDDSIKKQAISFLRRAIACVLIFFVPTIILGLFDFIDGWDNVKGGFNTCMKCLLGDSSCPNVGFVAGGTASSGDVKSDEELVEETKKRARERNERLNPNTKNQNIQETAE